MLRTNIKNNFLVALIVFLNLGITSSQTPSDSLLVSPSQPNMIFPNTLPTHPLGLYMSRQSHNFQTHPSENYSFTLSMSSGNVWLPEVKAYVPHNEVDRVPLREKIWHLRTWGYDLRTPADSFSLNVDGIFRSYRFRFDLPISTQHEFKFELRAFSIDRGRIPSTLIISDKFIEWFHTNIKGGEDPFARKDFGFDNLNFAYADENGNSSEIDKNSLIFSGIEINYSYYPKLPRMNDRGFFTNFSILLGGNTTHVNPSLDLGLNTNTLQRFKFSRSEIYLGMSLAVLKHRILKYGEGLILSNQKYLYSAEFLLAYRWLFKKSGYISLGFNNFLQSPYRSPEAADYYVLAGTPASSHWHYAASHLYRPLQSNSLMLTLAKKNFAFTVYLREDFLVDNAPDGQTGVEIKYIIPQ